MMSMRKRGHRAMTRCRQATSGEAKAYPRWQNTSSNTGKFPEAPRRYTTMMLTRKRGGRRRGRRAMPRCWQTSGGEAKAYSRQQSTSSNTRKFSEAPRSSGGSWPCTASNTLGTTGAADQHGPWALGSGTYGGLERRQRRLDVGCPRADASGGARSYPNALDLSTSAGSVRSASARLAASWGNWGAWLDS
jgi:hypothetical protein